MVNTDAERDIPAEPPRPGGLELHPFAGLRYDSARVDLGRVLAPPYDVIDSTLRQRLLDQDPHNVVRLTLPGEQAADYARAAQVLAQWRASEVLQRDRPGLYVYEQQAGGHTQRGLLGALALTPGEDGIVLPHENTMAGPVSDRLALTEATQANLEPIFLVYDGGGPATECVAGVDSAPPLIDVTDEGEVRHRLWQLEDPDVLAGVAADLRGRHALIADGHHRYATYLRFQRDQYAAGRGRGPWDRGLAFLVDAGRFGPQVHAIHRVVPGLPADRAAEAAAAVFDVSPVDSPAPLTAAAADGPAFVLSDGQRFWLLTRPDPAALQSALPAERSQAWRDLHVTVAHHLLFQRAWGLDDREGVVDFEHDEPAALRRAAKTGGTAVLLAPTPVEAVAAVAAAGERMPRKSTLFVPKPATGIVIRSLDTDDADKADVAGGQQPVS